LALRKPSRRGRAAEHPLGLLFSESPTEYVASMGRRMLPVALLAVSLAVISACASKSSSAPRSVSVTATGEVGPLRIDVSDRADVVAFAGKPDSERHGRYFTAPPFDALGYGCNGRPAAEPTGDPGCKAVFYLDSRSGTLELFVTSDPRFAALRGVHTGTSTAVAERLLHRRVLNGCETDLFFKTSRAYLVVGFSGGRVLSNRHLVGGGVTFLVVHSQHRNPSVLDCIDS
jgi:hypothetical protein